MSHHLFQVLPKTPLSQALQELKSLGIQDYYSIEENSKKYIGGFFVTSPKDPMFSREKKIQQEIDWNEQAQCFSPYYDHGLIQVPLKEFGFNSDKKVLLNPGQGFGDLSHPTTQLMLQAMSSHIPFESHVLDIGSGSGVLSFCAHLGLNAHVLGLEIDDKALELCVANAKLNHISKIEFIKHISQDILNTFSVILINMIESEQQEVFKTYCFKNFKGSFIISGLLKDQIETYLAKEVFSKAQLQAMYFQNDWGCVVLKVT